VTLNELDASRYLYRVIHSNTDEVRVAQAYLIRYSEDEMDTYIALTVILLALVGYWLRQNPRARH
jgi:hypothetical protein